MSLFLTHLGAGAFSLLRPKAPLPPVSRAVEWAQVAEGKPVQLPGAAHCCLAAAGCTY